MWNGAKYHFILTYVPAQIFPEEPPPLDKYDSDTDDDIFADLHTHAHTHTHTHTHTAPDTGDIVNDLFGGGGGGGRAGFDRDDVTEHTRVRVKRNIYRYTR